jgi:hypothetical protein
MDSLRALVALVLLAALAAAGCGGDDHAAERAELTLSLGFLSSDFGLTDAQVQCVATEIEEAVGGSDLEELATSVRAVDAGDVTLDGLPEEQGQVVRTAIATCAASG